MSKRRRKTGASSKKQARGVEPPPASSRARSRVLAVTFSLALALVGAEVALRAVGFEYQLRINVIRNTAPNPDTILDHFDLDPELLWVRGDYQEILDQALEERPPIVFMGDSCTHLGRYHSYLMGAVSDTLGRPVPYANLASAGWTTVQGVAQMKRDVARIRPQIATIYYGWNDHWLSIGVEDREALKLAGMPWFQFQELRLDQLLLKAVVAAKSDDPRPVRVPLGSFKKALLELTDEAAKIGVVPVLLTAPSSHAVGAEPEYLGERWLADLRELVPMHQRYVSAVREVARDRNVPLCDLAADFERISIERRRQRLFQEDGIHMQDAGDRALAVALYRCFEDYSLMPYFEQP
ncbi:MAG: SGNH/GDSL hydrolase family protein [Thermoanaerobaculia bacterium]